MVLNEALKDYSFYREVKTPLAEPLRIQEQLTTAGIMDLEEMGRSMQVH